METTSSDRVEVIGSDDDAEDVSCSTRAAPGAASPSDTDSDERLAGVEMVDLVNDLETAAVSGLGGNKRDRDDSAERSASPSTSSRSVRLKPDAAVAREPKGVESASDSEDRRGSPSRGDSDSAARSTPVAKPLTPDRLGGPVDDDQTNAPAPAPTTSDATAVNTAAAIETVLEGLARDEKLAEEDEEQFQKIPETMLAMPLLRHQRRAVSWMRRREAAGSSPRGGMLADDQGLGKTFSAIALIAANPPPPRRRAAATPEARRGNDGARLEGSEKPAGGTLVVCPTSVLRQWQRELESKVSKSANMRVLVHHGVGRAKLAAELAAYDVVLTTFAVVGLEVASPPMAPAGAPSDIPADGLAAPSDAAAAPGGAIGGVEWFRVILDEAQSVKNARSQVAAAVSAVAAKCRWCLSGTPLQNNVDDLFSYFRFLRYEPYGDAASFRTLIKEPIRVDPAAGFRRLQAILRAVMLRRTKQSRINGEPIVRLPPRTVVHSRRVFLPAEQKAYARLQAEYRGKMEEFAAAGTVSSNYVNLLHMLLRLRQACNHQSLVGGVRATSEADVTSSANRSSADTAPTVAGSTNDTDVRVSVPAGARVAVPASATAAARRLPAALRGMMRAVAEHGRCVCSICGDPPSDPTVASCCARLFCGDCVSPRVDALPTAPAPSAGKKEKVAAGAVAAADRLTADGFACPSCGTTLTRALLHAAAALVAADAPRGAAAGAARADGKGLSAAEAGPRAPRNAPGGGRARGGAAGAASGPSVEALMAGTKVRGIMDYLTALREKHKAAVAAAKAKATSRGKTQTQKVSPGGAAAAAAVAKGTQLRRGIRSSDAALAAALPPLAPVCAPGGTHQSHAGSGGAQRGAQRGGTHNGSVPPAEKAIVFSQWTAMLDLLEPCLRAAGIHFRRLDGTMSLAARERALSEFEAKPDVTVILMSLKAAGLGVNLTCANHVLLSDVWWNPAAEEQAIDRAHRIGQTREVRVCRFTVRDTVEDRILALQDRKRAMVAAAFGDEADDGFGGSSRRAQLTTEDLVFLFGSEKDA